MQKSLTINGKRFTAKQIAKMFDTKNMTNGEDFIVSLNGQKYFANYRQVQDPPYAPVCSRSDANAIALMPDNGSYHYSVWMAL
jgi:hypothetical protein